MFRRIVRPGSWFRTALCHAAACLLMTVAQANPAAPAGSPPGGVGAPARKPNVIVIFSDDQGWTDLACQSGRRDVKTPNLDAMAADGIRFAHGYVSAPVCVPSRAGILTGRYQTRFGMESNDDGPLPADEKTIGDRMRAAGYLTGLVGKWHVAGSSKTEAAARRSGGRDVIWGDNVTVTDANLPGRRGFDEYFCGAMKNYAASFDLEGQDLPEAPVLIREPRFRVEVQTEAALAFLRRRGEEPFFLYVAYFAPHVPMEAPDSWMERFADVEDPLRRTGLAMIAAVDDGVGRIRQVVRERGWEKDTLIFFVSDNGAPTLPGMWDGSLNEPLVGEKGMLTDGGIRVPYLACWPGTVPGGQVYEPAVISLDIVATALGAAGVQPESGWGLDGVDLLPFLTGHRTEPPHDALFWRFRSQAAVMDARWKLLLVAPDRWLLFDRAGPAGETRDVSASHPEVVARLQSRLEAWCNEQTPPGLPVRSHPMDEQLHRRHAVVQ